MRLTKSLATFYLAAFGGGVMIGAGLMLGTWSMSKVLGASTTIISARVDEDEEKTDK